MQVVSFNPEEGAQRLIFISGWAGYPGLFPRLSTRAHFFHPFISHELHSIHDFLLKQNPEIVVSWSLGAHICLGLLSGIQTKHLFLVSPFLDFTRYTPPQKIHEMIRGLQRDPVATVRWFWRLCGVKDKPGSIPEKDQPGLERGLNHLLNSRSYPVESETSSPVTLIHGSRDKIVPHQASRELQEHLKGSRLVTTPHGHFIPEENIVEIIHEQTGAKIL